LLISGIGKKSLKSITKINLHNYYLVIKAGTCAVIDKAINLLSPIIPDTILYCGEIIKMDYTRIPQRLHLIIKDKIKSIKIMTVDKPLKDEKTCSIYFEKQISLVEMEMYHIAKYFKDIIFIPLVVGTDFANKFALKDFFYNINEASEILKDELIRIIDCILNNSSFL